MRLSRQRIAKEQYPCGFPSATRPPLANQQRDLVQLETYESVYQVANAERYRIATPSRDQQERNGEVGIGTEHGRQRVDRGTRVNVAGTQVDLADHRLALVNGQRTEVRIVRLDFQKRTSPPTPLPEALLDHGSAEKAAVSGRYWYHRSK